MSVTTCYIIFYHTPHFYYFHFYDDFSRVSNFMVAADDAVGILRYIVDTKSSEMEEKLYDYTLAEKYCISNSLKIVFSFFSLDNCSSVCLPQKLRLSEMTF